MSDAPKPTDHSNGSTFVTRDSGARQEFDTGSRRDTREGKGRFDLIPTAPLRRLAGLYERGAAKYGDRNWERGQPLMRYVDSAMRHLTELVAGEPTEDHAAAVAWNLFSYMATLEAIQAGRLPASLDDRPPPEPRYAGPPTPPPPTEAQELDALIAKHLPQPCLAICGKYNCWDKCEAGGVDHPGACRCPRHMPRQKTSAPRRKAGKR